MSLIAIGLRSLSDCRLRVCGIGVTNGVCVCVFVCVCARSCARISNQFLTNLNWTIPAYEPQHITITVTIQGIVTCLSLLLRRIDKCQMTNSYYSQFHPCLGFVLRISQINRRLPNPSPPITDHFITVIKQRTVDAPVVFAGVFFEYVYSCYPCVYKHFILHIFAGFIALTDRLCLLVESMECVSCQRCLSSWQFWFLGRCMTSWLSASIFTNHPNWKA